MSSVTSACAVNRDSRILLTRLLVHNKPPKLGQCHAISYERNHGEKSSSMKECYVGKSLCWCV